MTEEETRLRDALGKGICDTKCLLKGKCDECGFYMTLKVLAAAERERDRLRTRLERAADMLQDSRNVIQALTLSRDPVHIRRADMDAAWDKAHEQAMKTLHGIDNFEPLTSVTRQAKKAEAACAEMRSALEGLLELYYDRAPNGDLIKKTPDNELRKRMDYLGPGTFRVGPVLAAHAALSSSAGKAMLERVKGMEGLLREIAQAPQKAQEMMRREGFVIDNLEDRWQKLAFTLYTKLAQLSANAKGILEEGDDDPGSDDPEAPGSVENEPKEGESRA